MLGAEQDIIANHVAPGDVRIVYWPMLDLGPNSTNAATAAFCAGEQDPAAFWRMHDHLFGNQRDLYLARRDFFVQTATDLGLDGPTFESCYDSRATRDLLEELDAARRADGVFQRPTFDVGDERLVGAQPYDTFAATIAAQLR